MIKKDADIANLTQKVSFHSEELKHKKEDNLRLEEQLNKRKKEM